MHSAACCPAPTPPRAINGTFKTSFRKVFAPRPGDDVVNPKSAGRFYGIRPLPIRKSSISSPILPEGGLPWLTMVKRKTSPPPELPEPSRVSTFPDIYFTDADFELVDSEHHTPDIPVTRTPVPQIVYVGSDALSPSPLLVASRPECVLSMKSENAVPIVSGTKSEVPQTDYASRERARRDHPVPKAKTTPHVVFAKTRDIPSGPDRSLSREGIIRKIQGQASLKSLVSADTSRSIISRPSFSSNDNITETTTPTSTIIDDPYDPAYTIPPLFPSARRDSPTLPNGMYPAPTPSPLQIQPCGDLLSVETLEDILQYHSARERLRSALEIIESGKSALIDLWLAGKTRKTAGRYADNLMNEIRETPNILLVDPAGQLPSLEYTILMSFQGQGLSTLIYSAIGQMMESTIVQDAMDRSITSQDPTGYAGPQHQCLNNSKTTFPNLFKSFYITDPTIEGNPIKLASQDLLPSSETSEEESWFLSMPEESEESCDLLTETDNQGNRAYSLVFTTSLVDQETGQCRYFLAPHVDITQLIRQQIIDNLSAKDILSPVVRTPLDKAIQRASKSGDGSRSTSRNTTPTKPAQKIMESNEEEASAAVDWLDIAHEEKLRATREAPNRTHQAISKTPTSTDTLSPSSFAAAITHLKSLHRDYFILAPSRSGFYEISYVSPSIFASQEYVNGHFTHTPEDVVRHLGGGLSRQEPLAIKIRWGEKGVEKEMYCCPMFGPKGQMGCWLCLLTEGD
ncbi:MAG: hypothetical protein M1827_001325 [Pycnora praestabilis]|nr:MAG: hypothetical protein M1827_001325 [Pycnora praestabilis]